MKFFQGGRCNATLGGGRSIQLSYGDNLNQAAVRDAGVQLPYYYKRNPAKKQDIIQSRPHSKIVWAALRLSYTEKGSTQARPSSHAAMLSAAKLIYGYRGCRFRRLLLLPLLPEVQNRYTFFSVRSLLSIKVWMMRGAVECIILSVKATPHNSRLTA